MFGNIIQPDWVCLDIGANIGAHALSMGILASRVIAFEASPDNFVHLESNIAAAGLTAKVEPLNRALWNVTGPLRFFRAEALAGCAFVMPEGDDAAGGERLRTVVANPSLGQEAFAGTVSLVDAVRLDDWAAEVKPRRIDLIKIDVEGAEAHVLSGGRKTLARYRPWLATEYNPACAKAYFGAPPDEYFRLLDEVSDDIRIVTPGGAPGPRVDWPTLAAHLDKHGWADLVCGPRLKR